MASTVPLELDVYLAREAPVGLIIRRGPAKLCCAIRWDRATDEFTVGQWVKHRIMRDGGDLAPDGEHFLYVAKWQWHYFIAISKPPFFTALVLTESYRCSGLFIDACTYWVPGGGQPATTPDGARLRWRNDGSAPAGADLSGRLTRDGWHLDEHPVYCGWHQSRTRHWRDLRNGWRLERLGQMHPYARWPRTAVDATYALRHTPTDRVVDCPDWTWADCDRDRIVWTMDGCLWTAHLTGTGLGQSRCLFDFRPLTFAPCPAPYEGLRQQF